MKHIRTRIVALICIPILVVAFFSCPITRFVLKLDYRTDQMPFSIEGWNSPKYYPDGTFTRTRLKMIDDLLKLYDFHGWSMTHVEQLLGKPLDRLDGQPADLVKYDLGDGLNLLIFQVDNQQYVISYNVFYDD